MRSEGNMFFLYWKTWIFSPFFSFCLFFLFPLTFFSSFPLNFSSEIYCPTQFTARRQGGQFDPPDPPSRTPLVTAKIRLFSSRHVTRQKQKSSHPWSLRHIKFETPHSYFMPFFGLCFLYYCVTVMFS